uniref:Uncharacterized protein n=1 Tax=Aegilops tauschii subsp. strangulata TaxID=200361 RepID=A0A453NDU5_AEGTS
RSGNMPPMVRTRSTTAVPRAASGGAELPDPGRLVPLSPFDAFWVALPPVRRVFLFRSLPGVPFSNVVGTLRSSLAQVLPVFHPFAGALTYSPDSRALSIVLPDEWEGGSCGGVTFVEPETDLDFERLVEEAAEHDQDTLGQLVPDIRRDQLPAPVMAAQVTEFVGGGGGVALGVAVHHTAADGRGIWRFFEMWAAAAAGVEVDRVPAGSTPLHDRRLVRFHGDEELARLFLRQIAPNLPTIPRSTPGVVSAGEPSPSPRPRCSVSSRGSRSRRTSARRRPPSPPWRCTGGCPSRAPAASPTTRRCSPPSSRTAARTCRPRRRTPTRATASRSAWPR